MSMYSKYKTEELQEIYRLSLARQDLNKTQARVVKRVAAELVKRDELPLVGA